MRTTRARAVASLLGLPLLIFAAPALAKPGAGPDRTATAVTCSPSSVGRGGVSTCTATVAGSQQGGATPTGTVTFSVTSSATLGAASCQLVAGSCSTQVTGSQVGTATLTATYAGDSTHNGSNGSTTVTVTARSSRTRVGCQLVSYVPWQWSCQVTVNDAAGNGTAPAPTGRVTFATSGTGFLNYSDCLLYSGGPACDFSYRQSQPSDDTLTVSYAGDATYAASTGTTTTSTTGTAAHPTTTHVDCTPDPVLVGNVTSCLIWAGDDTTGRSAPGPIAVTVTNPSGTTPRECMPAGGGCRVAVTPTVSGSYVVSASYVPDRVSADAPVSRPSYGWLPSSASTSFVAREASTGDRASRTQISCDPSTVVQLVRPTTTCTITVTGVAAAAVPSGTVTVTDGGCTSVCTPSGFGPCWSACAMRCTLSDGSCRVTLEPTCSPGETPISTSPVCSWGGTEAIQAHYGGDTAHDPSDGSTELTSVTVVQLCALTCGLPGLQRSAG